MMKRILALCMAMLLLFTSLLSCQKEGEEPVVERYQPLEVEAIDQALRQDYTADEDTVALLSSLEASFSSLSPSPTADFLVAETEGGVTITDYIGNDIAVRIPERIGDKTVVGISDAAFADCAEIKHLYIPDTVFSFGISVLKGCTALTALHTPLPTGENAYLGYLFGGKAYTDNAKDVPVSLVYLELGGNPSELPAHALFDCNDLLFVALPQTVETIGTYAFYHCKSLLALNVSAIKQMGDHALDSCSALTRLDFGQALTKMGFAALEGCVGLRRLTLPFVGDGDENGFLAYTFGAEVPDFAKGYYPPYLSEVTLLSPCTSVADYAFFECESLLTVEMSEEIEAIGVRAFAGCIRLRSLELPKGLSSICENAFFGCFSLESLAFAEGSELQEIGINAFYQCHRLERIALPAGLASLPASCFADCFSLTFIDLGGVKAVGKNAFHRCTALAELKAGEGVVAESGNESLLSLLDPD